MLKHLKVTQNRVSALLGAIRPLIYSAKATVTIEACHLNSEPIPFKEAAQRAYHPFAVGDRWGTRWDTTWFRFTAIVPED